MTEMSTMDFETYATVTLQVSHELLECLGEQWSPPVEVRVVATPGVGTGWEMDVRTVATEPPEAS